MRKQLDTLQDILDSANPAKSKVQIESLGKNLNTALARRYLGYWYLYGCGSVQLWFNLKQYSST